MEGWKALYINAVGEVYPVLPANGRCFTLEELYSHIGCELVEAVPLGDSLIMMIDEEGKLKNKPFNPVASQMYDWLAPNHLPGDYIVGTVVVCEKGLVE